MVMNLIVKHLNDQFKGLHLPLQMIQISSTNPFSVITVSSLPLIFLDIHTSRKPFFVDNIIV